MPQGPIGTHSKQAWKFAWPRDLPGEPPPGYDLRPGQIGVNRNYVDFMIAGLGGGGGPSVPIRWVEVSDTPPAAQFGGKLWYDSTTGNTYVWYDDGGSAQWVQMAPGVPGETVPPATDTILGVITEPLPDGRQYARTWDATGTIWTWVEVQATPLDFGDGLTVDRTQTPNIVNLQPATDASIGGIKEPPQTAPDQKDYVRRFNPAIAEGWEWAEATSVPLDFGIGLSKVDGADPGDPEIVHLQPAADSPDGLGGVYVIDRVRNNTEGLELGVDGRLRAPLATDALAGTLLEPPPDDKGYVRRRDLNGVSAWVPPADTQIDFGEGLTKDEAQTPPIVHLQRATDFSIGGLMEPPQDGMAYSRQFDPTLPDGWKWSPALTAGLQITSIIPDKAIWGPGEPLLTVHAYGMEFTGTTVIYVDDIPAVTTFITDTQLTFVLNPQVPINDQFHIITVKDPAAVPPDLIDGLGAEQFDFVKASTEVDYGRGLSLDTLPTPPIVNLDPAGPTNMGGVIVPVRDGRTTGLVIDMGNEALGDPATGHLTAPPATAMLLGTVKVPARTAGQGLTLEDDGGLYLRIATDQHLGGILEPSERDVPMARVVDPVTGLGGWEEIEGGMEEPPMSPVALWARSSGGVRGWLEIPETPPGGIDEPPASPVAIWGRSSAGARGWLEVPTFDHLTGFVEKIGDTMQGFLTLHDDPVNPYHAATRNWVELEIQLKVDEPPNDDVAYARKWKEWVKVEDAQGMEEPPANPVAIWGRSSAGDRGWLEVPTFDHLDGFVSKIGDTMTGKLTLDGPPVNPNHAATKDYVDLSEPQEAPYNGKKYARQDGQWVEIEPSEGGGIEEPPMQPVAVWGRTPDRGWVEVPTFDDVNGFVSKIGDTMTGALNLRDDSGGLFIPTQPAHAVNLDFAELTYLKDAPHDGKQYVREDSKWVEAEETGDTIEEPPMSPVAVWGRSSGGARGWLQIDGGSGLLDPALYVHVAGDTMQGTLTLAHEGALAMEAVTVSQLDALRDEIKPLVPVGRSPENGLENGYDDVLKAQTIWVPLATDKLAGSIVEPPVDGKQYVRVNDAMAGVAWVESLAKGVHTDDAPPMTPSDGALWWKSSTGALYVFYEDIDSGQWVQVNGTPSPDATISTGDTPPSNPRPNQLWFESDRGSLFFWYADADSSQWVEILGGSGGTAGSAPPVDLTNYVTHQQLADAVIDAQAFVTAASNGAVGHDTDLCAQALKAVESLSASVKQLQAGHRALKSRIQKLEAR